MFALRQGAGSRKGLGKMITARRPKRRKKNKAESKFGVSGPLGERALPGRVGAPRRPWSEAESSLRCGTVHRETSEIGLLTVAEATQAAASEGAELVVIAPRARPPVCRIVKRSIPSGRQVGGKTQS